MRFRFFSIKLKTQLTIIHTLYIVVFLIVFGIVFSASITKWRENEVASEMLLDLNKKHSYVTKNTGICMQISETVTHNQRLFGYISSLASGDYDIFEMLDFYRTEIKSLERLINSNPILRHIRIYIDSTPMLEMMPVVFRLSRAKNLGWYNTTLSENGLWFYDYADQRGDTAVFSNGTHQTAYVTRLRLDMTNYAVIEITAGMDDLFTGLFEYNPSQTTIFVDAENKLYGNSDNPFIFIDYPALSEYIDFSLQQYQYCKAKFQNESVIIAYMPLDGIVGGLVQIRSMKPEQDYIKSVILIMIAVVVAVTILIYFLIHWTGARLLRNLYSVMDGVKQIQAGNWDVHIDHLGSNEIGELGKQIGIMLERMKTMMTESIQRELLVKDSQLRALRNQINAHFLYNVLETIKMMALIERVYPVSDAITSLGELMRYNLSWKRDYAVLGDEIAYAQNYLCLINLRSDHKLSLAVNVHEMLWDIQMPKMSLQPIIENSIKHGLENSVTDTSIYIKAYFQNNTVFIEVSDMGIGMECEVLQAVRKRIYSDSEVESGDSGIGLRNIHNRIGLMYGKEYGVSVESEAGCYTKVIMRFPMHGKDEDYG